MVQRPETTILILHLTILRILTRLKSPNYDASRRLLLIRFDLSFTVINVFSGAVSKQKLVLP